MPERVDGAGVYYLRYYHCSARLYSRGRALYPAHQTETQPVGQILRSIRNNIPMMCIWCHKRLHGDIARRSSYTEEFVIEEEP